MIPPPIPENENARLESLRSFCILDTPAEDSFDSIPHLAVRIFQTPMAGISFVDRRRQWFKSWFGPLRQETSREISFAGYAILSDTPLILSDTAQDERFQDNPFVTAEPGIRFCAANPVIAPDGHRLGAFCIMDTKPRKMSAHDMAALKELTHMVEDLLPLRKNGVPFLESPPDTPLKPVPPPPCAAELDLRYLHSLAASDPANIFYVAKLVDAFEEQARKVLSSPTSSGVNNLAALAAQIGAETLISKCQSWDTQPGQLPTALEKTLEHLARFRQNVLVAD